MHKVVISCPCGEQIDITDEIDSHRSPDAIQVFDKLDQQLYAFEKKHRKCHEIAVKILEKQLRDVLASAERSPVVVLPAGADAYACECGVSYRFHPGQTEYICNCGTKYIKAPAQGKDNG